MTHIGYYLITNVLHLQANSEPSNFCSWNQSEHTTITPLRSNSSGAVNNPASPNALFYFNPNDLDCK